MAEDRHEHDQREARASYSDAAKLCERAILSRKSPNCRSLNHFARAA
jgi:hypothetical protein